MRFELTDGCPSLVFKTSAIDHSATLPGSPAAVRSCRGGGANDSTALLRAGGAPLAPFPLAARDDPPIVIETFRLFG